MSLDYINEAFKKLELLNEETFDTSLNGINQLSDFMDNDDAEDIVRVIDDEATSEEEIKDSYIGKVIVNCNVCHSHVFKNKDDIEIDTDGIVNGEEQCPYCGEQEGFSVVGEIAPFAPQEETPAEDNGQEVESEQEVTTNTEDQVAEVPPVEESVKTDETLEEDFKNVSITTDDQHMEMTSDENGKVTVSTEPVTTMESTDEVIVPVSDATQMDIEANNAETIEDTAEEPAFEDEFSDDSEDIDFDEIDEESLDELGEEYLKRVYENVDSYRTTDIHATPTQLIVEGTLKFNSGVEKKTGFIFEAKDVNSKGSLRFTGFNKHLTESKDAYTLVGSVKDKKLFVESFKYNYTVGDAPVRGVVRKSK